MGIRRAGVRGAAVVAVVLALAVGCSSSDSASDPNTSLTTTTTSTVPALQTQPRQSCVTTTLSAAAEASFPAAALVDVVCETDFATATLTNGPGGELVVLFSLENGVWVLTGSAGVGDAATAVPAGFSTTAVPAWQRLRDARLVREANPEASNKGPELTNPSSTQVNENGQIEICTEVDADAVTCTPLTLPPAEVADTEPDPDAPPTTATKSMFCKYNYNDPRCTSDPGFEPTD